MGNAGSDKQLAFTSLSVLLSHSGLRSHGSPALSVSHLLTVYAMHS